MTWVDIGEALKAIGAVLTGCAALWGAFIAFRGLTKWQDETLGKRKTEVAEQVLSGFYQVRDVIDAVRPPAVWTGEAERRNSHKPLKGAGASRTRSMPRLQGCRTIGNS